MAISQKDREFMEEVAEYYRGTMVPDQPEGSIRDTAIFFGINRTKVRKILITTGDIASVITDEALALKGKGFSNKEIAEKMHMSEATISTYLPYDGRIYGSDDASVHAKEVRKYREYERDQQERQKKLKANKGEREMEAKKDYSWKDEWAKEVKMSYKETDTRPHRMSWDEAEELWKNADYDHPLVQDLMEKMEEGLKKKDVESDFPGALESRDEDILAEISGERMPFEPRTVYRLHMELTHEYADSRDWEVLKTYGGVKHGNTISRDIIVPYDMPLYAIHFVIQRAFGWQNSHLHQFRISEERYKALTDDNAEKWRKIVGVVFRSPLMREADEFWADDYNGGSVKNWLRKKYTGPYMSQCHGEGLISCQADMMHLDMDEEYYVSYARSYNHESREYDGHEYLNGVRPVLDMNGKETEPPKKDWSGRPVRVERRQFSDLSTDAVRYVFDRYPFALIERLPIWSVLGKTGRKPLHDNNVEDIKALEASLCSTSEALEEELYPYIRKILSDGIDSPAYQISLLPFTDKLIYEYDFGDDWEVEITASRDCVDLVESGRITQTELDRANIKCRETYRPVLIARDGIDVMDDVGGLPGFTNFLESINPVLDGLTPEEREEAMQEKRDWLVWAKGQGWKRNEKMRNINLL